MVLYVLRHVWRQRSGRLLAIAARFICSHSVGTLKQPHQSRKVDIAVSKEHAVLRAIVAACEAQRVSRGVTAQLLRRAKYVVPERMTVEDGVLEEVVDELGGRVVVALYLVDNHLHLLVYLRLRIGTVEHDIGEQVDRATDVVLQHGSMIHRLLLIGEGI